MTHKTLVKKNEKGEVIATVRLLAKHVHMLANQDLWEEIDDDPDIAGHTKYYSKGA